MNQLNLIYGWRAPKLFKGPKGVSLSKTTKEEESWGTLPKSHHFEGRKACWNFGMGLGQTHKWKFKMMLTYTIKKRKRLVQVEWKWCDGLNWGNLKHKLHTACNLWQEAPLPSI